MAEKPGKWASNRGLISKIRPSDGCKGDTVPSTVVRGYDLRKPGGHLGNVGVMELAEKGPPVILSWGEKTGRLKVGTRDSEYRGG